MTAASNRAPYEMTTVTTPVLCVHFRGNLFICLAVISWQTAQWGKFLSCTDVVLDTLRDLLKTLVPGFRLQPFFFFFFFKKLSRCLDVFKTSLSRSRIARCRDVVVFSLQVGERLRYWQKARDWRRKKALWRLHCQNKHVECDTKGFHSSATVTSSCSLKTQRKNQYCANGALCPSTSPPIRPFILSFLSQFGEFCLHSDRLHFCLPSVMAKVCIAPAL